MKAKSTLIAGSFFLGAMLAGCGGGNSDDGTSTGGTTSGSGSGADARSYSGDPAPSNLTAATGSQGLIRTVDGRQVLYVVPNPAPTSATPLMIVLDYLGGNPVTMANLILASQHAASGEVFAFPAEAGSTWNNGLVGSGDPQIDITFLADVIADAVTNLPVNPAEISMTGYSEGGFMANLFACSRPDLISGYGMVAASQLNATACESNTPLRMIDIAGTLDVESPYIGLIYDKSAANDLKFWEGIDGCTGAEVATTLPSPVSDTTGVIQHQIPGCNAVLYEIVNGGHQWPGAPTSLATLTDGIRSQNLDATAVQWSFFAGP